MRKTTILALAAIVAVAAIPVAVHYLTKPDLTESPLASELRRYGYVPILPPSNLMGVGSLYYVDSRVKEFSAICHPGSEDLKAQVRESPSWEVQETLERIGRLATNITVDFHAEFEGDLSDNYVHRVHSSLSNVVLAELPLGDARLIFAKLMERRECDQEAMRYIRAGGYVCQGQKVLGGTVEFKLDYDTQRKLTTKGRVTADRINSMVKGAVEARSEHGVVERGGRVFSGAELKYGVVMNPLCLAPPEGRFARVLPRTTFDRMRNFVLFHIIEPMWPMPETRTASASSVPRDGDPPRQ